MAAPHDAPASEELPTLVHRLAHWATTRPAQPAIHGKRDGRWYALSWSEYHRNARAIAKALIHLGHEVGGSVAMAGPNCPEWVQFQAGIQLARGVPAPIYGNATKAQAAYIVGHAEARIAVVGDVAFLEKLLAAEAEGLLPRLAHILSFGPLAHDEPRLIALPQLLDLGHDQDDAELDARFAALTDDETCLMIYTSGTTGVPKGVEIDHGGQLVIGRAVTKVAPQLVDGRAEYHMVSYLPLSHQAEQLLTNVLHLVTGGQVYFCPEITQIKDFLVEVRPTVFLGVPRVWEKFEAALRSRLGEATGPKAKLAAWALRTELDGFHTQVGRKVTADAVMPLGRRIARSLVVDKIKTALGLDRLEVAITGSAPMAPATQEFFASLGIPILDAYGMTETSGAATISDPLEPAFGTVGKPFDGVEVRLGEENEIQLRGRNCRTRYRGMPEKTEGLYTEDGWLRTGDQGAFDAQGNLKITGRLKELLITAGGKNVAPVELEQYVLGTPGVGQVVVVGDRQPYLAALIALDPENLDALAEGAATARASMAEMARDPKVHAYVMRNVEERCNARVARFQTIKKVHVLEAELSVEAGELTPSMKLRRPTIVERHASSIAALYEGGTLATPAA
ncbi:MAG: long-chain fatty acid--CoA ligase [Myxococcota bacterium]